MKKIIFPIIFTFLIFFLSQMSLKIFHFSILINGGEFIIFILSISTASQSDALIRETVINQPSSCTHRFINENTDTGFKLNQQNLGRNGCGWSEIGAETWQSEGQSWQSLEGTKRTPSFRRMERQHQPSLRLSRRLLSRGQFRYRRH